MSNHQSVNASNKSVNKKVVLVLFHNDLRIEDNETLVKAATLAESNQGSLMLIYADFLADSFESKDSSQAYHFNEMGAARQQFLSESLADLDQSLQRLGNRLLYLSPSCLSKSHLSSDNVESASSPFTQLCQLIEQQQVTDICVSHTADYNQNKGYVALQSKYPQIIWHSQSTHTLFADLPTQDLPKSFTQFRKKVEASHDLLNADYEVAVSPMPKSLPPMPDALIGRSNYLFKALPFDEQAQQAYSFKGGEKNAMIHLTHYFDSAAPRTYKTTRNALDDWTHSTKFSPWLANGCLSINTLLNRLRHYEREVIANESTYWIWFELLWREYFYWYAIEHGRNLFLFKGIGHQLPAIRFDDQRLQQWQNGTTPYPIVNACMNQLKQTGYMSNRGRQIVASCFIHELGLDWRYGATYFEQHLIDYDVASNWGNWQYLAGVGADPRGCRQFNLNKQTQQYDPNGDFVRQWQGVVGQSG
ncbi:DASH family cryptochrome [Psychrobacter aquimaris]|uniref:DASH family cryptochrome n=1 Tax=Psychrobacter aquimaris TaxID=292733 RepID=UPI0018DF43AD|nr:DASH family cryptochrome [Psychrobacter aquimaris]